MASFGQKDKQQAHQQWLARMPLPHPAPPAPTSHRKPGNPADQTLTAIVDQLTAGGYPFTMPTRNATASLTTPRNVGLYRPDRHQHRRRDLALPLPSVPLSLSRPTHCPSHRAPRP